MHVDQLSETERKERKAQTEGEEMKSMASSSLGLSLCSPRKGQSDLTNGTMSARDVTKSSLYTVPMKKREA